MARRRRLLRWSLVAGIAAIVTFAGGISWLASVPGWYASNAPADDRTAVPGSPAAPDAQAPAESPEALLSRLRERGVVTLDDARLAGLATELLSRTPDGREFLRISDGIEARIGTETVELGGTFDLAELDQDALSDRARESVADVRRYAPFLLWGERYLGFRGVPVAVDGRLGLAPGARILIGGAALPPEWMGWFSGQEPEEERLELPGLRVTGVLLGEGRLSVEAEPISGRGDRAPSQ